MKALVNSRRVLLFGFDPQEESGLRHFFEGLRFTVFTESSDRAGCTVGALLRLSGFTRKDTFSDSCGPLIVFSGISGKELQTAVSCLKRPDILKASVTPSNQNWSISRLYLALWEERAAFSKKAEFEQNA